MTASREELLAKIESLHPFYDNRISTMCFDLTVTEAERDMMAAALRSSAQSLPPVSDVCAGGVNPGWNECQKCGATADDECRAAVPASSGEVRGAMAFIGKRLEDLAEANALYGKERHLSTPDKIARNNREISWLKDLRSILALKSSPSLAATLRQRAIDLRRNSSGGDDFDPKAAEFCAGILDSYANDIESGALR